MRLVECFEAATNTCPIASACTLKRMLKEALDRFVVTLDRYTLADVLTGSARKQLTELFTIANAAADP